MFSDKTEMESVSESDSGSPFFGESEESLVLGESEGEEQEREEVEGIAAAPKTIRVQMRRTWVGKCGLKCTKHYNSQLKGPIDEIR